MNLLPPLSIIIAATLLFISSATSAQEAATQPIPGDQAVTAEKGAADDVDESPKKLNPLPEPVGVYMGRRVAQTMHYLGAEWLIRDRREREERCSMMLANLGVRSGMTICDMGCGNGFHTLRMAQMTGKNGTVIGVDAQPEMLGFLRDRMEKEGIENVIPILGSFHNPRLPAETVDLLLMVDVYHEFSHPEPMLKAIRKALKPDGLMVLVEYREEDPDVPIKPLHKMSKAQINKEMNANGFELKKEFDKLPWQHMMFFGKTAEKNSAPSREEKETRNQNPAKKLEHPTVTTSEFRFVDPCVQQGT